MSGHIIILSAPSRCGKDTVVNALNKDPQLLFRHITTFTTRAKRPEEKEGVHHFFVTPLQFRRKIAAGEFLEWARVRGGYFGTPLKPVEQALSNGENILLKIEVQGMEQIKKLLPKHLTTIFITPQSIEDVRRRLKLSGFSALQQRIRLTEARREMSKAHEYDYVLTNYPGKLSPLIRQVRMIVKKTLSRPTPPPAALKARTGLTQ